MVARVCARVWCRRVAHGWNINGLSTGKRARWCHPNVGGAFVCGVLAVAAGCLRICEYAFGGSLASWVLESGVRVLCGLYGLACCWVLRQQASVPVGWVLVGFSALCGGFGWCVACGWRGSWCFGVCPVFAAGALVWWRFCAVARVCLWGCGVVVWELYSEREHLADEMSLGVLFLGSLGV